MFLRFLTFLSRDSQGSKVDNSYASYESLNHLTLFHTILANPIPPTTTETQAITCMVIMSGSISCEISAIIPPNKIKGIGKYSLILDIYFFLRVLRMPNLPPIRPHSGTVT